MMSILLMEELKVQNSLLLQLVMGLQRQINSKNRQNQILFQQYDQLAADNRLLQTQIDQLKNINAEIKRQIDHKSTHHEQVIPPVQVQVEKFKKQMEDLNGVIMQLKIQLEERGRTIILLQEELRAVKLQSETQVDGSDEKKGQQEVKLKQLEGLLQLKEQSVRELTEYMHEQALKITELTQSGIFAIDNYEAKLAEKDTLLQTVTTEATQLKEKLAEKTQQLQAIIISKEQSIQELSEFLHNQTAKIAQLETDLSQVNSQHLQEEILNLKQIISSKQQSIVDLSEFLNSLTNSNKQMEQNILSLQTELEEKTKKLFQLQQNDEDRSTIEALKQLAASKQVKIAQLINNLEESESILRENEVLRAHLSTREDESSRLHDQLEDAHAQMSVLRTQLDQKILKITMLQNISEQNDGQFPIDQQVEKVEEHVNIEFQEEEAKEDYEALLQLKSSEIEALKATIDQKDQSLRDFTDFITQQTDKIIQLEKAAHKQQQEGDNPLQEELAALKSRLFQLQNSLVLKGHDEDSEKVAELHAIVAIKQQSNSQLASFLEEAYAKNAEIQASLSQSQKNFELVNEELKILKAESQSKKEIVVNNTSSEVSSSLKPNSIEELRSHIIQLESTLSNKNDTITELTDFMNQQAEELQQLRKHPRINQEQSQSQLIKQIQILEGLLKAKEVSQAEMGEFLKEAFSKIAELEQEKLQKISKESQLMQNTLKNSTQEQNIGKDTQKLYSIIQELQETIKTKSQTIVQLSEFMNEQSLRIEQLEEELKTAVNTNNPQLVEELHQIIKAKEASAAELTDFLQQSYAQNVELAQYFASVQAQKVQVPEQQSNGCSAVVRITEQQYKTETSLGQINILLGQKQAILNNLNSQIEEKHAILAQLNAQCQEYQSKISNLKRQLSETTDSYNAQVDQFNLHLKSLQTELQNASEGLQEIVTQIEESQKVYSHLQQEIELHKSQIKQLEQAKTKIKHSSQHNQISTNLRVSQKENQQMKELKAKIAQYQGYLNEREEEMTAMMEVMELLQAEIKAKSDLIEQLNTKNPQQQHIQQYRARISELEDQLSSFKVTIGQLKERQEQQQQEEKVKLQAQYELVEMEQQLRADSKQAAKILQQELTNIKLDEEQLEKELNLDGNFQKFDNGPQQVDNNQELTVLQVIEQMLVYSEEGDMSTMLRMMEVLKRSYLNENECILKENSQLRETLEKMLEINNSLVEETEKFKEETDEQRNIIAELKQNIKINQQRMGKLESNYQQQIKTLRKSISAFRQNSPIVFKDPPSDLPIIVKLEEEVDALRQENRQKEEELQQLRANSNRKFVKELNNLLDSRTVPKQGEDLREMEEELQRVTIERDEGAKKCNEIEQQLQQLQKQCIQLRADLQNAKNHHSSQSAQAQDSLHTAELLAGLMQPNTPNAPPSDLQEQTEKLRAQNQQLHALLMEKSAAISQLEETMLGLEKGYNSEIMGLRKNIAELKGNAISLRKSLYQANPNGVDIAELIKETFSQSDQDTEFFRPAFPTYTNSLFLAQQNNSYYSDVQQHPRPPTSHKYQRYFPPTSQQLTMGEKFMGRKCRQGSPFGNFVEASRATAWDALRKY